MVILSILASQFAWSADLTLLREQARETVKVISCGGCHTPNLPTTKEHALKVYKLAAPYWTATMDDRQLTDFQRRIKTQNTIEDLKKSGIVPIAGTPSRQQVHLLNSFIEEEIKNRRIDPTERFRQIQETRFPEFHKVFATGIQLGQ